MSASFDGASRLSALPLCEAWSVLHGGQGYSHHALDGVGCVMVAVEVMTPCVCDFRLPTGPSFTFGSRRGTVGLGWLGVTLGEPATISLRI